VSSSVAVNIFAKIAFQKKLQQQYEIFHPYTIQEGDRADTIAYLYYGDSGYDWLVYFCNDVVDPYYDWYMDTNSFKRYIEKKYGSIYTATRKIKFFRTNYLEDISVISTSGYLSLTGEQKRFWNPVIGINNNITSYERKKEDVVYETNHTKELAITYSGEARFIENEYVIQESGGVVVSTGTVKMADITSCIVNNIVGLISTSYDLIGGESGAISSVSSITNISSSFPATIETYFSPVSYYDYENELNEKKKNIKLIDASYVNAIESEFKNLLSS
jgi:hypothetical protein